MAHRVMAVCTARVTPVGFTGAHFSGSLCPQENAGGGGWLPNRFHRILVGHMIDPARRIYCNRTLNLRSIQAIGYDMDYTLIHYDPIVWERRAYEFMRDRFLAAGWPVNHLKFDPGLVTRGLIIDTHLGNLVKANRFGFVKRAIHGEKLMEFEAARQSYSRTIVELSEPRWVFLNSLFSLSEGCMYAQMVSLLDAGKIPERLNYQDLWERVRLSLDAAHTEGILKAEIIANPEKFVQLDPDLPLTLQDQQAAGKRLMLITNSEWSFTQAMMTYAFDRYMPKGKTWRDLFEIVIVSAMKPDFFAKDHPAFEMVTDTVQLKPPSPLKGGAVFFGGSAKKVEKYLGLSGDEILYVGDHMFGDVRVSKNVLQWRTALVLRELEDEVRALGTFRANEKKLAELMLRKEEMEHKYSHLRLVLQRRKKGYGPKNGEKDSDDHLQHKMHQLRSELVRLDEVIAPLAKAAGEVGTQWGPLMRAGNDKSHLARQLERYADIYTSRVSNFMEATPFVYLRSPRGSLPHDPT